MAITQSIQKNGKKSIDATDIRDVVFPLFVFSLHGKQVKLEKFLGTGFLIGSNNFVVTAKHVIEQNDIKTLCLLAILDNEYTYIKFKELHNHLVEDISVLKIEVDDFWDSFIIPSNTWEGSSCPYQLWGYPDLKISEFSEGKLKFRPELCYYESYIVRRFTQDPNEEIIKGKGLFELGFVAYPGCSGSPIIKKETRGEEEKWKLIGVYTGNSTVTISKKNTFIEFCEEQEEDKQKNIEILLKDGHLKDFFDLINDYSRTLITEPYDFGVAVREDAIREWLKEIDHTLYH